MDPKEACLTILGQAPGETLHWTVVLDRALTQRLIDPFTTSDVRGVVVKSLAADDMIEVAGPMLAQCARLDDEDLIGSARSKGQGHLLAISQRASLSEAVTDVLVTRGDHRFNEKNSISVTFGKRFARIERSRREVIEPDDDEALRE